MFQSNQMAPAKSWEKKHYDYKRMPGTIEEMKEL